MSDTANNAAHQSDQGDPAGADSQDQQAPDQGGDQQQETSFTQAQVDELMAKVRNEERRKAASKYADYDDLKAQAGEKKSADERIAALEKEIQDSKHEALRRRVQAAHGISDEAAELLLTGTDEDTLIAQAKALAERTSDHDRQGNYVPHAGTNPTPKPDRDREFADFLTGH